MTYCPRCRAACAGDAFCSECGLRTDPGAQLGAPRPPVPGPVLAVQILLGLGIAGVVLQTAFVVVMVVAMGSLMSDLGAFADETVAEQSQYLAVLTSLFVLIGIVSVALGVWFIVALGRASRVARLVITVLHASTVLTVLVAAVFGAVAGEIVLVVAAIVVGLPLSSLIPLLLWVPQSSRRFFGDPPSLRGPGPSPALPSGPMPHPLPAPLAPPRPGPLPASRAVSPPAPRPVSPPASRAVSPPAPRPVPLPAPRPAPHDRATGSPPPDDAARTDTLVVPPHVLPPSGGQDQPADRPTSRTGATR